MNLIFNPFKTKRYLGIAKEPVYVGTGGYRIGRVDNTIIRDCGTNLPKIPGTTISGNARYYSWLAYKSEGMSVGFGCAKGKKTEGENACGKCPVCLTYGFINEEKAHSGLAYFSDAKILFFPVATMIGTVWITSDEIVKEFIETNGNSIKKINREKFYVASEIEKSLPKNNSNKSFLTFGWIMLELEDKVDVSSWKIKNNGKNSEVSALSDFFKEVENRICIVSKEIFHHIVNSNLETRTSVSINPVSGAAESGALFTYEALPRGTVFVVDITYENPKNYGNNEYGNDDGLNMVIGTVEKGLELFSSLGIGGMGTRGFGKIEIKGNMLDEKQYWGNMKEYLGKLKGKYDELNKKLTEIENEINSCSDEVKKKNLEKDKTQICKEMVQLIDITKLYQAHMENQKKKIEEKIDYSNEILSIFSLMEESTNISIPDNCENETGEEKNDE